MGTREKILRYYRKNSIIINFIKRTMQKPKSIVMMNGGICSQMQQYLIGHFLRERGDNVEFDLDFYTEYTLEGALARNFDLLKLFPTLEFREAPKKEITMYKKLFRYLPEHKKYSDDLGNFIEIPKTPVYVDGYYDLGLLYYRKFKDIFKLDFNIIKDEKNRFFYSKIKDDEYSVGIHVRRGDMAYTGNYWKVLKPNYYVQAINYFDIDKMHFYFFSDEREWIYENIIPLLDNKINFRFVDCNTSENGYLDLMLLSLCRHQIASQGSFGKYAWLLNEKSEKTLIMPKSDNEDVLRQISEGGKVITIETNNENSEN